MKMLKNLIEKLEDVEHKLRNVENGGFIGENVVPHEHFKSLTNTVNILNSLVNKTIQNNNYDDDIAFCHSRSRGDDEETMFTSFGTTEEFLNEVKNVHIENKSELPTYLIKFLDLLSDLVFSVCEISNFKTNLASGIKVKDLVTVKNFYITLWDMLSSLFQQNYQSQNTVNKIQSRETRENVENINSSSDVVTVVELCLKDMSKVKLEIEHYVKSNLIELQFKKQESNVKEDNTEKIGSKNFKPQDNNSYKGNSKVPFYECLQLEKNQQSMLDNIPATVSGPHEHYLSSWENSCDYNFTHNPQVNFFNPPIIYSSDVLFFEPQTVVLKQQVEPTKKHSLAKIYSLDSVEDHPTSINYGNSYSFGAKESSNVIPTDGRKSEEDNVINKQLFDNTAEDLFTDNLESKMNEEQYIQLKEKISSLLTMMKEDKVNDKDFIFDVKPIKVKNKDSQNFRHPNEKKQQTKTKEKSIKGNRLCKNITGKLKSEDEKKQDITKNKTDMTPGQNSLKKDKSFSKQFRLNVEKPIEVWEDDKKNIIYDKRSVIELFKPNRRNCNEEDSVDTDKSNFGLWPVLAEYIYVSKGDGYDNCHSVSSSASILLSKRFEKSFYSLQMNKSYEQKQLYDGDIIVLHQDKKNSNVSLCKPFSNICKAGRANKSDNKQNYHLKCADSDFRNQKISLNNLFVPTDHRVRAQQQTFAVHYADCADSFMVTRNYKKENINFFDFNNCNSTQNWDSFLSIITKFGTNTHINERRMFRKIVKNLGGESLHENNLFGNVQTLTSSGGPFRLFDINGYPLTDSEGNVLKDPYGKCVVELDSTGLPKDNTKVFDAAGHSPKDVKFDPTQKPHSNCISVKLTDNFKRPLQLFDKYGRPLTDYSGRLLVNIHGRPLLRFDNFGRPNTDYRGGPLYTNNGFRWSFKEQSLSKEQISDEISTPEKVTLPKETTINTSNYNNTADEQNNCCVDNYRPVCANQNDFPPINSRNSDMWLQVENVLKTHSKNIKFAETPENELLVNNVTVKPNLEVKEYLSQIIYHHNGLNSYANSNATNHNQYNNGGNMEPVDHQVNKRDCGSNHFAEGKINCGEYKTFSTGYANVSRPFFDNVKVKSTLSKYFKNKTYPQELEYFMSNFLMEKNNYCKGQKLMASENPLRKNQIIDVSMCCPTSINNRVPNVAFKNDGYINNLCNEILKSKIESKVVLKDTSSKIPQVSTGQNGKKDNLTDITLSNFTSSFVSKYTNGIPLYTDSPTNSVEYQQKDPQILKILEDISDPKFKKHDRLKNLRGREGDLRDHLDVQVTMENNKNGKSGLQKVNKNKDTKHREYPNKSFQPSGTSTETNTYIDVLNKQGKQYQINVRERMRTGYQPCEDNKLSLTENDCTMDDTCFPERENNWIKTNINVPEKDQNRQLVNLPFDVYHGEFCRHFKKEKELPKNKDSPFRFTSDEKMETTTAINNKSNSFGQKHEKRYLKQAGTKPEFLFPKLVKKPQRNYRDCNLVSFLGTPVKYVLNKLDTKLSSRQEKRHKYTNSIYQPTKDYYGNEKIVETLYYTSKDNKKFSTSNETNSEHKECKKYGRKGEKPAVYKSKSYSEIQDSRVGNMSYSGSQETSNYNNKCPSDTVVSSGHKQSYRQRKHRRYEVKKPQNEQYSFETHYVHTNNTTNPHHHRRNEKIPKGFDKQKAKSSKMKPDKLFKKSGKLGIKKRVW